jgi:hypothetical protein
MVNKEHVFKDFSPQMFVDYIPEKNRPNKYKTITKS